MKLLLCVLGFSAILAVEGFALDVTLSVQRLLTVDEQISRSAYYDLTRGLETAPQAERVLFAKHLVATLGPDGTGRHHEDGYWQKVLDVSRDLGPTVLPHLRQRVFTLLGRTGAKEAIEQPALPEFKTPVWVFWQSAVARNSTVNRYLLAHWRRAAHYLLEGGSSPTERQTDAFLDDLWNVDPERRDAALKRLPTLAEDLSKTPALLGRWAHNAGNELDFLIANLFWPLSHGCAPTEKGWFDTRSVATTRWGQEDQLTAIRAMEVLLRTSTVRQMNGVKDVHSTLRHLQKDSFPQAEKRLTQGDLSPTVIENLSHHIKKLQEAVNSALE